VNRVLKQERDIEFSAKPLETSRFEVAGIRMAYVFYEDGLAVNVMYTIDDPKKRAVGFKLSEGMEVPKELEERFKFAGRSPSSPARSGARSSWSKRVLARPPAR